MADLVPTLDWKVQGYYWIAWLNDLEFYSIKPVTFVDDKRTALQFEVRLNDAVTGTAELIAVGYDKDDAEIKVHKHRGAH